MVIHRKTYSYYNIKLILITNLLESQLTVEFFVYDMRESGGSMLKVRTKVVGTLCTQINERMTQGITSGIWKGIGESEC